MHFGTWKAGSFSEIIMELGALLTDIPLQTGYSPLRWWVAIDALLLKKIGVRLVEKLRSIVLFQGDLNYLNKYIGLQMMNHGEAYEQLSWEEYGSHERNKAINQALNKVLSFYLIQLAWVDAAMCANDDKSCYDRIVHEIASILMQHQNVPVSACICIFTTLQNLHHTIRTIYGIPSLDMEEHYGQYPIMVLGKATLWVQRSGQW
jgi:hypothetical protein